MANPFISEIRMFAGNFAPRGFALCDGQILPISQNTALFSLLGTNFGGNGTTNFALPNLQGMHPMHFGNGAGLTARVIGETGGESTVTLTTSQMPTHTHTPQASPVGGTSDDPTNNVWAEAHSGKAKISTYTASAPNTTMNGDALTPAGGGQPHNNLSPYLTVTFIIAIQGIYPARN